MHRLTCGFIGLGLIGGSIAKALKESLTDVQIIVYDISETTLSQATEEHIADIAVTTIDETFRDCDYIFLCAPVQKNNENLLTLKQFITSSCCITDVGSVKSEIHTTIHSLELDAQFIGGHPMAGSERIGYLHSKALLLQNAYYILTPTESVPRQKVEQLTSLVQQMGALPLTLSFEQHDYITAAISHLPHVVAASLVNLVKENDSEEGLMKMIAAGGFKDITRIASSSSTMWQQICLTNTDNIAMMLERYIASLQQTLDSLKTHDEKALYEMFHNAHVYRDSFVNSSSGPIKRSFSITIDIADEPGALASIATILALNQISIKNIGIVHNREYEGGVLRIEFYEEAAIMQAKNVLSNKGYTIYDRTAL